MRRVALRYEERPFEGTTEENPRGNRQDVRRNTGDLFFKAGRDEGRHGLLTTDWT